MTACFFQKSALMLFLQYLIEVYLIRSRTKGVIKRINKEIRLKTAALLEKMVVCSVLLIEDRSVEI